ncbi:MAG: hypothetical protein E6772_15160 [Dysgonomonas sp.]|nr:hypothetical protein [Dysgonomonas sp.]
MRYLTYEQEEGMIMNKLLLYFMVNTIAMSFLFHFISGTIVNIIQLITLSGFFWNLFKLASFDNIESKYLKKAFLILSVWVIYITLNGINLSYDYIKEYLFWHYRYLHYLIPLILLIPLYKSVFIHKLFSLSYLLGCLFLILLPFYLFFELYQNQDISEMYIWVFATGSGFLLLTANYHTRKEIIVSSIVVFLGFILATVLARRNIMLTYAGFMFASFWIYLFYNKVISIEKKIISLLLSATLLVGGFYVFTSNQQTIFSKITSRAGLNTRDVVFLGFALEMNKDKTNLIFGKGINGTYYAPGVDSSFSNRKFDYRNEDYRMHIENGYLQLILNGGIIYLVLFLAILIPAIVIGLFRSHNLLVKGCAILVFLWLIDMIAFGVPAFSFRYLLVWICVGICFSAKLREKNNEEMTNYLNPEEDENTFISSSNS